MPKFRIKYTRDGLLSYLSHLDIIRLWQRTFARSCIEIEMSQGHSPRPKIGFGPPLAVGHRSDAEYLDANVKGAVSAQQLVSRLNEALPDDIRVVHARRVLPREAAVAACIEAIQYRADVADHLICDGSGDGERAQALLEEFEQCEEVTIERFRKGRIQRIDLRKTVRAIELARRDSFVTICILIDLTQGAYPKPEEVLQKVFCIADESVGEIEIRRVDVRFRGENRRQSVNAMEH